MQISKILFLLIFSMFCIQLNADVCNSKTLNVIERLEAQIELENYSVVDALIGFYEKCNKPVEELIRLETINAELGRFDSQKALSSIDDRWLQLLAYRGDAEAMTEYGRLLLDSRPEEAFCWIGSSLLLGRIESLDVLEERFTNNKDIDGFLIVEVLKLKSKVNRELFTPTYYRETKPSGIKVVTEGAKEKFNLWLEQVKSQNKEYLIDIADLIETTMVTLRKDVNYKIKFTGQCSFEDRFPAEVIKFLKIRSKQ